jgi:hypothetical protein
LPCRVVSIVTRLQAGLGFESQHGQEIFPCPITSRQSQGPIQSPLQWILGLFNQEIKQPGHMADHRPLYSTKVMNDWRFTFTSPICLCGMHMDRFTHFTFITVTEIISANVID